MCWHPHCSLWIAVPSSSYFSHGLVPTLLAQGLPFPFKSGCMWGVLDDSWHTLMLDHVADCRLAWFTCSTSSSEREPWPCPRPLPQQGGSSASSSCCSWDLWGRMWACVFRGLGGSAGWGQCKDFCCFPVCSVPLLLECWFLQWCCLWTWFGGMHFLTLLHPISWLMGRTFPPVQSLLGPLSQLPLWHCPRCGYIPCLPLSRISSPNITQVTGGTGSSLCFVTCRYVSFLLASGSALTAARVSGTQIPVYSGLS